jgi:hypothetical protein
MPRIKAHCLFKADFSQGSSLNPLSEFVDSDAQVGQALRRFLEGSQQVQTPHDEMPCDEDDLELLGWHVDLSSKVLSSLTRPHKSCWRRPLANKNTVS